MNTPSLKAIGKQVINRRSDAPIRQAIDDIQNLLFDPNASEKIFPLLLDHIKAITSSDYAAIFTIHSNKNTTEHLQYATCAYYGSGSPAFVSEANLRKWLEKNLAPLRPIFYNQPIPNTHAELLLAHAKIASLLILPIVTSGRLRSVCILAKSAGDYRGATVARLTPLVGSVICALHSADSVKGNTTTLNEKIASNQFLSSLLSTSPLAVMVLDSSNTIAFCNPAALHMFIATADNKKTTASAGKQAIENKDIHKFIPNFDSMFQWSNQHDHGSHDYHTLAPQDWENQKALRSDGSNFLVNITIFRHSIGSARYTTLQVQDITAMRTSAEEYQEASQQLAALTHLVPVAIVRVDANWNCVFANDKWYEFSGLTFEEIRNTGWIDALHSDDVKLTLEQLSEAMKLGNNLNKEVRLVSPLGQIRWADLNTQVLYDEHGAIQGFLATFADITERYIHQERLRHIAEYDSLTGLANRYLFQDRLQQAFYTSERDGLDVVVMFLDLDGFKNINDSMGHGVGDLLLKQVSERLLNTLRRSDTVARFGGDEFVILLCPHEKNANAAGVASKIIQVISQLFHIEGNDVYVTSSIGIATGSAGNSTPEKILKQADAALYLAKTEGKNNFQLFNDELDKQAKKRVFMSNQLRSAMQHSRFYLEFQAQANVANSEIVGFEALLRFNDDKKRHVYPNEFIGILEESSAIIEVGKWVIEEACKQLREWYDLGHFSRSGFLSINVSPKQFLDDSLASFILNTCNRYSIDPSCLIIEVTESVLIDKPKNFQSTMSKLRALGVKFALDDFGTGYSSLTYLQNFPFDHIKIDKSFVFDLAKDQNNAKITKSIIALGQSMGLKVTAEGVTEQATLDLLKDFGADYYQGYHLGKATLGDKAIEIISPDHSRSKVKIMRSKRN